MSNQPSCPCCGAPIEPERIYIDPVRGIVVRNGRQARLSRQEFSVFAEIAREPGAIVSGETLRDILTAKGSKGADKNLLKVIVCHIRKQLDPLGVFVEGIWGVGYEVQTGDPESLEVHRGMRKHEGPRNKLIAETDQVRAVARLREESVPHTEIAMRVGITFQTLRSILDDLDARAELEKRNAAA